MADERAMYFHTRNTRILLGTHSSTDLSYVEKQQLRFNAKNWALHSAPFGSLKMIFKMKSRKEMMFHIDMDFSMGAMHFGLFIWTLISPVAWKTITNSVSTSNSTSKTPVKSTDIQHIGHKLGCIFKVYV